MIVPLTPIRCMHRAVDLYGKKIGVVCGSRRFTYAEFGARAERLATALEAEGLRPGERVAYLSFNNHQLLEGYFGVIQAHGVVMPLNVRLTTPELIAILNHSEARILLFENDFVPLVKELRPACPGIEKFVTLDEKVPEADFTYEELLSRGRPERADIFSFDERATAELFYTSGSTGTPKGVMLSHRTLYLHALSVAATFNRDTDVELHTIPLFHANGWGRPQASTLMGVKHVMVRRFEPTTVFRLIEQENATAMSVVPTMANALLNAPGLAQHNLSSLKTIHVGGAAASPELIERLEKAFHCECLAGYGLTETAPVATSARKKMTVSYKDEADRYFHQSMAGWPIPGVEIRVVDAEMRDVPRDMDSIGEVVIFGDHVMDGYFKEPEATAAVMTQNWFHSGDMAVWDEESYIHIVDRKKDIIISGGENISSVEVEGILLRHPSVQEVAVVGLPHEKWGEAPCAFVVLCQGASLTEGDIREFARSKMAHFKVPQ
jgi:fatty-acyl-CoA synthase